MPEGEDSVEARTVPGAARRRAAEAECALAPAEGDAGFDAHWQAVPELELSECGLLERGEVDDRDAAHDDA